MITYANTRRMACATLPWAFVVWFSNGLVVVTFVDVSIKQPCVVCFYCLSLSIEFIVIIVSLGNTLNGQSTAD